MAKLLSRTRHIYGTALRVYRAHWRTLLLTGLIVFVPASILEALADELSKQGLDGVPLDGLAIALVAAGANTLAYNMYKGVATNASMLWRQGSEDLSVATVLRGLPYLQLIIVDIVLTVGTSVGFVLLIVPGVLFATVFSLAPVLLELERRSAWSAMKRSYRLVRQGFVLALIVQATVVIVVDALEEGVYALGHALVPGNSILGNAIVLGSVTALLASLFVKPISALAVIELTQKLREVDGRKAAGEAKQPAA